MKLITLDDPMVDYKIALDVKEQLKEKVLEDAAIKGIMVDYSELEQEDVNDILKTVSMDEFIGDEEIEI